MKKPIYQINNLSYSKNNNTILNIKNFEIHRGTCYMISGSMGSGKSLLLNILSKKIKNYNGDVLFNQNNLKQISNKNFLTETALVPQISSIPFFKSTETYIKNEIAKRHNDATFDKKFKNIVTNMDLKHLLDKKMRKLTPSQFRWVDLASKIASYPKLLFIDELELHLSKKNLISLSKILYRKCNYDGVTLIATTQNPEMFTNLTSVNISLNQGRITKVRSFSHRSKKKR